MKTQIPLNEIIDRAKKAETLFIDLKTEPLHKDRGILIVGEPADNNLMDQYKQIIENQKEKVIVYSGRGFGKLHTMHQMALAHAGVTGTPLFTTMELTPDAIKKRISQCMTTRPVFTHVKPKPLQESYKERFRKLALQQYHEKQLKKSQSKKRLERAFVIDSMGCHVITSYVDNEEQRKLNELLRQKFDKALGDQMFKHSTSMHVINNPNK